MQTHTSAKALTWQLEMQNSA